ncbi:MAG: glycosyltransferase family 39 protein [Ignavibacteria bacterium]|nr:glycosyltransferase family 39 protein [Ignavibacteria bacterium]
MIKTLINILKKVTQSRIAVIVLLLMFKALFQFLLISSGMKWLTADDYSRTVISWEWLQDPRIYSGVWLSMHFWISGVFIWLFNDLIAGPVAASILFSSLTLIFLYLTFEMIFGKTVAVLSSLIYCVFPFQVWLSSSAMPEPIFFFFITFSFYCFLLWYKTKDRKPFALLISVVSLGFANLLRYEGWFFTASFIILIAYLCISNKEKSRTFAVNIFISLIPVASILWWLYQNFADYGDALYFIKETNRIYSDHSSAGTLQKIVQYPFFIFYIAPITTLIALPKILKTFSVKTENIPVNFKLIRLFLFFNLLELLLLTLGGVFGTGGTNMISRYVVLNSIFLFPFAVWQLTELRNYILVSSIVIILVINVIWSYNYQLAYREDTYEVAELTRNLVKNGYISDTDKVYFEPEQGYYDIFALKVISNKPQIFTSDTIPTYFSVDLPSSRKTSRKKKSDEQLRLNILELRKFIESKNIKLFIARSDLLIDKLKKLSYKKEQIGDYHIFYISDLKVRTDRNGNNTEDNIRKPKEDEISFDRKFILKDFRIDNSNLGINPQTVSLKWELTDISLLDSLNTETEEYGRYKAVIELAYPGTDSIAYDTETNIFSERNVEDFFETEEIKNIMILKPFALLYYSVRLKPAPFESGLYEVRLSVNDLITKSRLKVYRGDSLYIPLREFSEQTSDTVKTDHKIKKIKDRPQNSTYYLLGNVIAMFPNANYNAVMKKSSEVSRVIIRNGFMLPFLNRHQGDHMLDIVFTYF